MPHEVTENVSLRPLMDGRRIMLTVHHNLSVSQCLSILDAYLKQAGPEGQVSVRRPDSDGYIEPFCVKNLDEDDVIIWDTVGGRRFQWP